MKKIITICFILCGLLSNAAFAQDYDDEEVMFISSGQKMPKFPGGDRELRRFISENIKYPAYAEENRIEGRAVVSFTVEKDGSLADIEVMRSPHESLSEKL